MEERREVQMHMEMVSTLDGHHHVVGEKKVYPSPIHTHEEVLRDREAFMDALRSFHSSIGSKLTYCTY
jgi:hypothetical protein